MNNGPIICERCKIKTAVFNCQICRPFHSFCSECDSLVHSLPSKQTHQRSFIKHDANDGPSNNNYESSNEAQGTLRLGNNAETARFEGKITFETTKSPVHQNIPLSTQASNTYQSKNIDYIDVKKYFKPPTNTTFTREYVNELKVFKYGFIV